MRVVPVLALFFLCALGCAQSPLERHVRSARDVRELNDNLVATLDAHCLNPDVRTACRENVLPAQGAFAAALDAWVATLDRERDASRWDEPRDAIDAAAVGSAYDTFVRAAAMSGVPRLPALPSSFCAHTHADACPARSDR